MRISETLVTQLVDSDPPQVVLADDMSGAEIVLDPVTLIRFEGAVAYFRLSGGFPGVIETCIGAEHPPVRVVDPTMGTTICACGAILRDRAGKFNGGSDG